jgi:hypothetical protein
MYIYAMVLKETLAGIKVFRNVTEVDQLIFDILIL